MVLVAPWLTALSIAFSQAQAFEPPLVPFVYAPPRYCSRSCQREGSAREISARALYLSSQ